LATSLENLLTCLTCGLELTGKQTKFCSRSCHNSNSNAKHQVYEKQQARGLRRKIELLNLRGGGCEECGYRDNLAALCFHHKDEDQKKFELTLRELSNHKEEVIAAEFKKCIVLCHNCHTEHHNPTLTGWYKK